jgi:hypothetical protein
VIGQLSSLPDDNSKLWISPNSQKFAVNVGGSLILREISEYAHEIRWIGSCIGAMFSSDSKSLVAVEIQDYKEKNLGILLVSHLSLPEMSLQSCWTMLINDPRPLMIVPRDFYDTIEIRDQISSDMIAFCSSDGKDIIPPLLFYREDSGIQYSGRNLFKQLWHGKNSNFSFAGEYIGWMDENRGAVVSDMSLLIRHM